MSHRLFKHIVRRPHGRWYTAPLTAGLLLIAGCVSAPRPAAPGMASNQVPPRAANQADGKKDGAATSNLARTFDEAVARGDNAWRSSEIDMAIYQYIQALSFRPRDVTTLSKLGAIEQAQGNLQLAARAFDLAANADPNNERVTARLGQILLALGQDDDARSWLQRGADAHSTDWRVYDALGVLAQRRGDGTAALEYLRQAVMLAPAEPAPLLHRGQALFGIGDYEGAEASVHAALAHGDGADAHRLLGQIQAKRRDYAGSLDTLLHVMDPSIAYGTVAQLALDNGDNATALELFEKSSDASPVYSPETQRNVAIARERLAASNQ
jgi:tetratricopeptide (TPR) repeat protein